MAAVIIWFQSNSFCKGRCGTSLVRLGNPVSRSSNGNRLPCVSWAYHTYKRNIYSLTTTTNEYTLAALSVLVTVPVSSGIFWVPVEGARHRAAGAHNGAIIITTTCQMRTTAGVCYCSLSFKKPATASVRASAVTAHKSAPKDREGGMNKPSPSEDETGASAEEAAASDLFVLAHG